VSKRQPPDRESFYDDLAPVYHLKVNWRNRLGKEQPLLDSLIQDPCPAAVLDLGCGDGGHSDFFAAAGIRYVGIDNSAAMLAMARRQHRHRLISFHRADLRKLPRLSPAHFDLCLLLGNTLPHLHTQGDLNRLLAAVRRQLNPGGRFAIQTVNPALFARKSIHFLSPALAGGTTLFAPFYVRRGDRWDFHMMIHTLDAGRLAATKITTTRLRFWSKSEITRTATASGFRLKASFGNAALAPYQPRRSENLILVFERA